MKTKLGLVFLVFALASLACQITGTTPTPAPITVKETTPKEVTLALLQPVELNLVCKTVQISEVTYIWGLNYGEAAVYFMTPEGLVKVKVGENIGFRIQTADCVTAFVIGMLYSLDADQTATILLEEPIDIGNIPTNITRFTTTTPYGDGVMDVLRQGGL